MKNVLLIGPYNRELRSGQFLAPPLGVYRLASNLKGKAEVDVVDPSLDALEAYIRLSEKRYDIIGHSVLHTTLPNDIQMIFDAHQLQPQALQIAGGQGASFNHQLFQKTPVNIVARGTGEAQLESIIKDKPIESIAGLYVNGQPTPNLNGTNFTEISMNIDFSMIPYERYWGEMSGRYDLKAMKNEGMLRTVRLMTSNYCPMGCSFCSSTNFLNDAAGSRQKIKQLTPPEILYLMKNAVESHPETEAFYFNDDDFLISRQRADEFCSMMENMDYNLMCMGRVDDVDKNLLKKMKHAGFKIIFYGVETFSGSLARDVKKSRNGYEKIARKSIEYTLDAGITPQMALILFLPTTTQKDLEVTIDNAVDLVGQGARVTVLPYVEAYSGATIVKNGHKVRNLGFKAGGEEFAIPYFVSPDNPDIENLAAASMQYKEKLNSSRGGKVSQPVDALNLFKAVYTKLGKSTDRIDDVISDISWQA